MFHTTPSTNIHIKIASELSKAAQKIIDNPSLPVEIKLMQTVQLIQAYRTKPEWQEGILLRAAYNHLARKYNKLDGAKTVPQLHAVIKALDPTKHCCPTLNEYAECPQFKRADPQGSNFGIKQLSEILLDPNFYIIAIQLDLLALIYWVYIMSFIRVLLENKFRDIYLEYTATMPGPFELAAFFKKMNATAKAKGAELLQLEDPLLNILMNFFSNNTLVIASTLSANPPKEFYIDELGHLPFKAGFNYERWLIDHIKELISKSGFTALAEAINETAIANFEKTISALEKKGALIGVADLLIKNLEAKSISLPTEKKQAFLTGLMNEKQLHILRNEYVKNGGPTKTDEFNFFLGWNLALLLHGKSDKTGLLGRYPGIAGDGYQQFSRFFITIIEKYIEEISRQAAHSSPVGPASAPPRPSRLSDSSESDPAQLPGRLATLRLSGAFLATASPAPESVYELAQPMHPSSPNEYELVPD